MEKNGKTVHGNKKMKIDCVSDLHGFQPNLPGGDLLILAGDYTLSNKLLQWGSFFHWLSKQNYSKKILIGGNHDGFLESCYPQNEKDLDEHKELQYFLDAQGEGSIESFDYLCDSPTEYNGLKIWGSPWTPTFYNWHFMKDRGDDIKKKWDLIPEDIDILITHGPPYGILDVNNRGEHCGCMDLREAIFRVKPKVHVFGHVHEQGGKTIDLCITKFINASIMDSQYKPSNKPVSILLNL